jgi:excisionase family DNA binding protein
MKAGTADQLQHPEDQPQPIRRAVLTIDGETIDEIFNRIKAGELEAYLLPRGRGVAEIELADCPASPAVTLVRRPRVPPHPVAGTPRSLRTVKEAAEYYHVSQQTIRRMIKSGKLKVYRVGRQIRIDQDDLVNCISA